MMGFIRGGFNQKYDFDTTTSTYIQEKMKYASPFIHHQNNVCFVEIFNFSVVRITE